MAITRVLFDGWPLVHQANGPEALHLLTLLSQSQEGIEPLLALPSDSQLPLKKELANRVERIHHLEEKAVRWQQRVLPRLAEQHGAKLIHTTMATASLLGRVRTLVSPASYATRQRAQGGDWRSRIGQALGRGGLARAIIIWPNDLPIPKLPGPLHLVPPAVHPDFGRFAGKVPANLELPESYLLYHGPGNAATLLQLLESWTWAAASIGELYPLAILGLDEQAKRFLEARLPEYHLQDYVVLLPRLNFQDLVAVYQTCSALVHPASLPAWGSSLRRALVCGKAAVAFKTQETQALVGSAAYLVPPGDLRGFGAAMITILVDDQVRSDLESAAKKQSSKWKTDALLRELQNIYLAAD